MGQGLHLSTVVPFPLEEIFCPDECGDSGVFRRLAIDVRVSDHRGFGEVDVMLVCKSKEHSRIGLAVG